MTESRRVKLLKKIVAQRKWVDEHGGDIAGYVERYGSCDDVTYYGSGGEAIYKADRDALMHIETEYQMLYGTAA